MVRHQRQRRRPPGTGRTSAIRTILRYQGADGAARLLHAADGQLGVGQAHAPVDAFSSNSRNGAPAITSSTSAGKPSLIQAPSRGNGRALPEGGHSRLAPPPQPRSSASSTNAEGRMRRQRGRFPCACWKRGTWMRHSKSRWASCAPRGSASNSPMLHGSLWRGHHHIACRNFCR